MSFIKSLILLLILGTTSLCHGALFSNITCRNISGPVDVLSINEDMQLSMDLNRENIFDSQLTLNLMGDSRAWQGSVTPGSNLKIFESTQKVSYNSGFQNQFATCDLNIRVKDVDLVAQKIDFEIKHSNEMEHGQLQCQAHLKDLGN